MSLVRPQLRVVIAAAVLLSTPAGAGVPGLTGGGSTSPVRTHPLAAGELLLEVGGVGFVTSRADLATLTVTVSSDGETQAEARRANRAEVRRVIDAARRAGIPADAIETGGSSPAALINAVASSVEEAVSGQPAHRANDSVTIRVRDIGRVSELRAALGAAGADTVSTPIYSLTDRGAARRQAQARALAAARADADAYAASTGMRLVRLVRVSERVGDGIFTLAFNNEALFRSLRETQSAGEPQTEPDIPTIVLVGADYALAPR